MNYKMERNELSFPGSAPDGEWTTSEQLALRERLTPLLARRAALYAAGDSSMRVETARELLQSIVCTLDEGLLGAPRKTLLSADLDEIFARGARVLEQKKSESRELWSAACLTAPKLNSQSLRDTLRELGRFWKRYDARFFAHRFPCDIDYPLLLPVPEDLSGVSYLEEYLRRLLAENALLAAFDPALVSSLLDETCSVWRFAPANLAESVLDCAVGLALLGRNVRGLILPDEALLELETLLAALSDDEAAAALDAAAGRVCDTAGLRDGASRAYLAHAAAGLLSRLRNVPPDGWRGVFPAPRPNGETTQE